MKLEGIIFIAGKPGLFKVVGQGKNNIIVENLEDKKRTPAYSSDKVSALDDISIYTTEEDKSLSAIFDIIHEKEKGGATASHKDSVDSLQKYMDTILPTWDKERVYPSDIKKLFQWYNILHKAGALELNEKEEAVDGQEAPDGKETKTKVAAKTKTSAAPTVKGSTELNKKGPTAKSGSAAKSAPKKSGGTRGS